MRECRRSSHRLEGNSCIMASLRVVGKMCAWWEGDCEFLYVKYVGFGHVGCDSDEIEL